MHITIRLLLFLLCFSSVHAGLFSSSNPYIAAESVTLYSNTSSIDTVDSAIEPQNYKQNIVPNTNLTQPDASGLSGVLYDRGLSCQVENTAGLARPALLTQQAKIALVERGNCSFADKVLYSQMDGAAAVIIYDSIPFEKDPRAGLMDIPANNITIVAYYVDRDVGLDLLRKVQQEVPVLQAPDNTSYQKATKVILYPSIGGFPSAWEFTLIIVVALLAISFLASVGMHWHLWRIRRRQRLLFESGLLPTQAVPSATPMEKTVIDPSMLTIFPTRIVGSSSIHESTPHDIPAATPDDRRLSVGSTRSGKALENAEALAVDAADHARPLAEAQTATLGDAPANAEEACVICLDEFSSGETVRRLPCGHEYHCECIDPWLTVKSASCPLCKHDCSLDVPKPETEETDEGIILHTVVEPPPRSHSPLQQLFRRSPAFGPTIQADRAEEFSRSWVARSLPRNMRRQINEQAAALHNSADASVIELPARMQTPPSAHPEASAFPVAQLASPASPSDASPSPPSSSFRSRLARSLPRYWRPSR